MQVYPASELFVLGVDGGQSSTLALVASASGAILGVGRGGPSNHVHEPGGMERLESALRESIGSALQHAEQTADRIGYACLGMTGGANEAGVFARSLLPNCAIETCQDNVIALAGASIAQPGVIIIAGTGSVAYGKLADGRSARAGGWGYLMGDEGSAYQIGIAALSAATRASDRRSAATLLLERIPAHFGHADLLGVHRDIYGFAISRPQIAGLAAVVSAAAHAGDAVAQAILAGAGQHLGIAAAAVIEQLGMSKQGMAIYTTGGVFQAGAFVLNPFRDIIQKRSPASRVEDAAFSPIIGALLLALQAAGITLTPAVIQAIKDTAPQSAIAKHLNQNA